VLSPSTFACSGCSGRSPLPATSVPIWVPGWPAAAPSSPSGRVVNAALLLCFVTPNAGSRLAAKCGRMFPRFGEIAAPAAGRPFWSTFIKILFNLYQVVRRPSDRADRGLRTRGAGERRDGRGHRRRAHGPVAGLPRAEYPRYPYVAGCLIPASVGGHLVEHPMQATAGQFAHAWMPPAG